MIDPKEYTKLRPGTVLVFEYGSERTRTPGKLLYVQNVLVDVLDEQRKPTGQRVTLPMRCGFEPVEELTLDWVARSGEVEVLKVWSIHLEAGRFAIHESPR